VKESGWGREVGEEGVLAYTETKTVTALLGD
jgi:p-cumic aldehyde dehydrogenase